MESSEAIEESVSRAHPREVVATMTFRVPSPIAGIEDVFSFVSAEDVLPVILTGYGWLPGVVRTSGHSGQWNQPGSVRTVHLEDGSTAQQELTAYDAPTYFAYRTSRITFVLRRLVEYATETWRFAEVAGPAGYETEICWTFTFHANSWLQQLLLELFVHVRWLGYMRICARNVQRRFVP